MFPFSYSGSFCGATYIYVCVCVSLFFKKNFYNIAREPPT